MTNTDIPDIGDTDLTREEMEEVAAECGIDPAGLDDQQLLERLGVALGEIDESEVEDGDAGDDSGDGQSSGAGLRAKVAARLGGAADRLRPAGGEPPGDAGSDDDDAGGGTGQHSADGEDDSEQSLPGEPIEGPTRNELRDELRELGLSVAGTKDELQRRLDEAHAEQGGKDEDGEDEDGEEDSEEDTEGDDERLRDRAADRLHDVADWLHETGREEDSGPSRLKLASAALKRRLPFVGGRKG